MRPYAQAISDATGITDPTRLAMIEEQMRAENGGVLDHLTPRRFRSEAKIAAIVVSTMERDEPGIFELLRAMVLPTIEAR